VVLVLSLEFIELASERGVRGQEFSQSHEGTDYKDAHLDGAGAAQDGGGHDGTVLGQGVGRESWVAVQCLCLGSG
jgi:hypothetical protein